MLVCREGSGGSHDPEALDLEPEVPFVAILRDLV
jgi:hypothetical protein